MPDDVNVNTKELTYSVLRYYEDEEIDIKILKIRNLWGVFSWKGEWSQESTKWTKELKEKVDP